MLSMLREQVVEQGLWVNPSVFCQQGRVHFTWSRFIICAFMFAIDRQGLQITAQMTTSEQSFKIN